MHRSQLPDNFSVEASIPTDEDGYLDRACSKEVCEAAFKILVDDWKSKVRDEEVFCPVCGHTAISDERFTEAQAEHLKSAFMAEFQPLEKPTTLQQGACADTAGNERIYNQRG